MSFNLFRPLPWVTCSVWYADKDLFKSLPHYIVLQFIHHLLFPNLLAVRAGAKMQSNTIADSVPVSGTSGLGSLVRLPQELRDKIYEIVFDSGHTALLRASRRMHENAKDSLYRDLILQDKVVRSLQVFLRAVTANYWLWLYTKSLYCHHDIEPGIERGHVHQRCTRHGWSRYCENFSTSLVLVPHLSGYGSSHQEACPLRSAAWTTATSRDTDGRACCTVVAERIREIAC